MRIVKRLTINILFLLVAIAINVYVQAQIPKSYLPNLSAYNFGSLGKSDPLNQIKILKKTGFKGIVLNTETETDSLNLNFFLSALKSDTKFKIHAVMVRYNFTDASAKREAWRNIIDQIAYRNIELWVIFGKKTDGFDAGFIENKLREINVYAFSKKVKVILYPHSKCVLSSTEEALPLVQKLNHPNLRLAVHLCHEIRAGNGARLNEVFEAAKGYVGAVTVCGSDSVADFSKPFLMDKSTIKPIGEGNFDMRKFITPLLKSGYKGLVGFINFKIDENPEMYLRSSIENWKAFNLRVTL